MSNKKAFDSLISGIQNVLMGLAITFTGAGILALLLVDTIIGAGFFEHFISEPFVAIVASLATDGLINVLMATGVVLLSEPQNGRKRFAWANKKTISTVLMLAAIPAILDMLGDGLFADILRHGTVTSTPDGVDWLLRIMFASISMVGNPLAMFLILGFDVVKGVLSDVIETNQQRNVSDRHQRPVQPMNTFRPDNVNRKSDRLDHPFFSSRQLQEDGWRQPTSTNSGINKKGERPRNTVRNENNKTW